MSEQVLTWRVCLDDRLVGTARLQWSDQGIRSGSFVTGPGYGDVKSVFRSFAAAEDDEQVQTYYKERDALGLVLLDEEGSRVGGVVHILDYQAVLPNEPLEIEIYPSD